MTYNPSIPQATDLISNSQSDLLTNFGQLNTQFAIDHTAFYTGSTNGDGKHKQINFPAVTAQGAQTDPASVLYTKSDGSVSQLFFKNQNGDQQITQGRPIRAQILLDGATGVLINAFNATSSRSATGTYTVTFTVAAPSANYSYSISTEASGSNNITAIVKNGGRAAGSIQFGTFDYTGVAKDAGTISVTIWGG